jgi:hypothetical protein
MKKYGIKAPKEENELLTGETQPEEKKPAKKSKNKGLMSSR